MLKNNKGIVLDFKKRRIPFNDNVDRFHNALSQLESETAESRNVSLALIEVSTEPGAKLAKERFLNALK